VDVSIGDLRNCGEPEPLRRRIAPLGTCPFEDELLLGLGAAARNEGLEFDTSIGEACPTTCLGAS